MNVGGWMYMCVCACVWGAFVWGVCVGGCMKVCECAITRLVLKCNFHLNALALQPSHSG